MNNACKIVMYHYVRPIKNSKYPGIKGLEVEGFLRQINYLKKNYHILTPTEFIDILTSQNEIKKKCVLLTFDDGLKDHFLHVYPILKKNGLQGSFFVSSKPILERKILDVHKIQLILAVNENIQFCINEIFEYIEHEKDRYGLISAAEYYSKLAKPNRFDMAETIFVKRILQRELPLELREKIVGELFQKYFSDDVDSIWNELYLTENEIKEMGEAGMYFGSHGHSHEWYTQLPDKELKMELEKSFNFCSQIIQKEKRLMFCYPYGNYDNRVIENIKTLGFIAGLTTEVGDSNLEQINAFNLNRYDTNDFPQ